MPLSNVLSVNVDICRHIAFTGAEISTFFIWFCIVRQLENEVYNRNSTFLVAFIVCTLKQAGQLAALLLS